MAWNGSRTDNLQPPKKESPRRSPRYTIGVLTALVVFGTVIVFWPKQKLIGKGETEHVEVPRAIEAHVPSKSTESVVTKKQWPKAWNVPDDWEKPYPPQAYWPDGTLKKHSRYVKVITNSTEQMHRSLPEKVFENGAEQHIGLLLSKEPGTMIIGEMQYGERFVKKFLRSCEVPIIISKDDPDEVVALKKAVMEAKIELKARYDAGEDIAEIMNQTRRELVELGSYRHELDNLIRSFRKEHGSNLTSQDYENVVAAANKMLDERGCAPIKNHDLHIQRLKLREAKIDNNGK